MKPEERVAYFVGWQRDLNERPIFPLWTLTQDVPGHPIGSTISGPTLRAALGLTNDDPTTELTEPTEWDSWSTVSHQHHCRDCGRSMGPRFCRCRWGPVRDDDYCRRCLA
jgi:hypothetical protein